MNNQLIIQLYPWIFTSKKHNSNSSVRYQFNNHIASQQSIIIAIVNVKPQTLNLIGKFNLNYQNQKETLAYLSQSFCINQRSFQIAFVPYQQVKIQADFVQSICDILKFFSSLTIADVSCIVMHKYTQNKSSMSEAKQLVIVNGKEIYQIQSKENKLQLLKKVQFQLDKQKMISPELVSRNANLQFVQLIMVEYMQYFHLFLNSDKNWRTFADIVLMRYRAQASLQAQSLLEKRKIINDAYSSQNKLMNKLQQFCGTKSQYERNILQSVLQRKFQSNKNYIIEFLEQLKCKFDKRQINNHEQLLHLNQQVSNLLRQNNIPSIFISYFMSPHENKLLIEQNRRLQQKQHHLQKIILERDNEISSKKNKIKQLKQLVEQFTEKAEEMKQNTMKLIQMTGLYEQEKQKNWKLSLEVDSYIFMGKKNTQSKLDLESKFKNLTKQRRQLLSAIQQLTAQNLTLMTQRENLKSQNTQLKDQLEQSNIIEARALQSIENQAQIKVRLSRYQNYVGQLKQVFTSFKKAEVDKINFILSHNYKQYEELQEKYKCSQFELRRSQGRIKQLQQNLHCEKVKLSYFEKMFMNSYQNDIIPQVSEQNSTERQVEPIA